MKANPEALDSRIELVVYYGTKRNQAQFTTHLLWFIHNHPDIGTPSMAEAMRGGEPLNEETSNQLASAWEKAVGEHPLSVSILTKAATFIETINPEHAINLRIPGDVDHDSEVMPIRLPNRDRSVFRS